MKKDLASYIKHDQAYQVLSYEQAAKNMQEFENLDYFGQFGFKKALEENPSVRGIHIDIGSGAGWLLRHTAPVFKKVLAIEPSISATKIAKQYNSEFSNIEYINKDMLDALSNLYFTQPYFVTTSTVFSHIQDFHVKSVLKLVNRAPKGSILLFLEPYDKNIHQPFWYIRNKEWWQKNLSNWRLDFLGVKAVWEGKVESYQKAIYGVCEGKLVFTESGSGLASFVRKCAWFLQGTYFKFRYWAVGLAKKLLSFWREPF